MATGHEIHKLGRHHNCQYGSHHFTGMEKMQFNHFPYYKSMGALCCHGNQTKRQINKILAIFKGPQPSNILTKLGTNCFNGFGGVVV